MGQTRKLWQKRDQKRTLIWFEDFAPGEGGRRVCYRKYPR